MALSHSNDPHITKCLARNDDEIWFSCQPTAGVHFNISMWDPNQSCGFDIKWHLSCQESAIVEWIRAFLEKLNMDISFCALSIWKHEILLQWSTFASIKSRVCVNISSFRLFLKIHPR
jgi:hypothetical protein